MAAMTTSVVLLLATIFLSVTKAIQPGAAPARQASLRPLEIGHINFLHTTDTHGWNAGHLREPSYSADWGDYISFSERLREKIEAEGNDLLIVDTGDHVEGGGPSGAIDPRGFHSLPFLQQQRFDLICPGHRELHKNASVEDDFHRLLADNTTQYLASNLYIHLGEDRFNVAHRYRIFTTKKRGIRVLAFGFIPGFFHNDKNTYVQPVETAIEQPWFHDAILNDEVDLIVVIGHIGLRSFEFEAVHRAVRRLKPHIPVQFFGGQHHVRDYRTFDDKAHGLASGRFMETIGFQSISSVNSSHPEFARSFIDHNLHSLYYHSGTNTSSFSTDKGLKVTETIAVLRNELHLDQTIGCANQSYWMTRVSYPHNHSIYTLLTDAILLDFLNMQPVRRDKTRLMLVHAAAIGFDIFAGPVTKDSALNVCPSSGSLFYIADVPYKYAKELLPILNNGDARTTEDLEMSTIGQKWRFSLDDLAPPEQAERNYLRRFNPRFSNTQNPRHFLSLQARGELSDTIYFYDSEARDDDFLNQLVGPRASATAEKSSAAGASEPERFELISGHVTHDDLGFSGDDTIHSAIEFFEVPNVVQAIVPGNLSHILPNDSFTIPIPRDPHAAVSSDSRDDEMVDVVFHQFLAPHIVEILNILPYVLDSVENDAHKAIGVLGYEPLSEIMLWGMAGGIPYCVMMGACPGEKPPAYAREIWNSQLTADERIKRDELTAALVAKSKKYTIDEVKDFLPGRSFTNLFATWIYDNWKDNCEETVDVRVRKEIEELW